MMIFGFMRKFIAMVGFIWDICPGMIRKNSSILRIIDELAAAGQAGILLRKFPKGHLLIGQDSEIVSVYFIRSGIVKCSFTEDGEKEYILEFLGEGQILGEIEAISGGTAISGVMTITEISVYVLDRESFLHLLRRDEGLNRAVLELMARRLADTAQRSARQQLNPLEHSLAQLLEALEHEKLPCTKQELANYLGVTVRSLNRLLKS